MSKKSNFSFRNNVLPSSFGNEDGTSQPQPVQQTDRDKIPVQATVFSAITIIPYLIIGSFLIASMVS